MRMLVLSLLCTLAFAVPAFAQDGAAETSPRLAELREWFSNLPESRKVELKRRLRVVNNLPPERRREMLDAARQNRPILTEQQRENIRKLARMAYLQRVRLLTTAAELHALRHARPEEFNRAMKLEGPERVQALRDMLHQHRRMRYLAGLPEETRDALRAMQPRERERAIRDMFRQESERRIETLESFHPRINELRQAARDAPEPGVPAREARAQLRRAMADLRTLDMLLQRLQPEAREAVMERIRDLSIERSAQEVRRALQKQWQQERRRRPDARPPRDRNERRR